MTDVWFWQTIISPHMANLAVALARQGSSVTYVALEAMTDDRAQQGWIAPTMPGVTLKLASSSSAVRDLVNFATVGSIHICQGLRANAGIGLAQRLIAARRLRRWVVAETVKDTGWYGVLKRLEYSRLFRVNRARLQGVLAIGHRTTDWVVARGMPIERVFPFAYFLPEQDRALDYQRSSGPFRFVFVGQLIPRKRLNLLIEALAGLIDHAYELLIVGTGPEVPPLRTLAMKKLGARVRWLGHLPISEVPAVMAQADCLVLPSVHDGWGAVASEALMVGTPVICSDACGVAGVVRASGKGGVFAVDDQAALAKLLAKQLEQGQVTAEARLKLANWATCLGATSGAAYLVDIFTYSDSNSIERPIEPWSKSELRCVD